MPPHRRPRLLPFLLSVWLVCAIPLQGSSGRVLRILSWNIYMLPNASLVSSGQQERAPCIGRVLAAADYDIVVLQEAFHKRARREILARIDPCR